MVAQPRGSVDPHIARTVDIFLPDGRLTEVRFLDWNDKTVSGYFAGTDRTALYDALAQYRGAAGIYFIANAIKPGAFDRRPNRAKPLRKTDSSTSNDDIERRLWFIIDADPNRVKGVAATDEEHAAALAQIHDITTALRAEGWPDGVIADSGNGAYACFRVDLPRDDNGVIARALKALNFRFSDEIVTIDESVADAAQLVRFFGTVNRKGAGTTERPHRRSCILEAPDELTVVSADLLEALARQAPEPPKTHRRGRGRPLDLDNWIAKHGLEVTGPTPWKDGRKWVAPVCWWNSAHTNRSAYIVQFGSGAIDAGCHHNSCADRRWMDLRELFEPGHRTGGGTSVRTGDRTKRQDSDADDISTKMLADAILEDDHFAQDAGGKLYVYGGGTYRPRGETHIRRRVKALLEAWDAADEWSSHRANEVVEYIRVDAPELWDRPPVTYVNVQNGLLNIETGGLKPHSPGFLSTTQIPVAYNPSATCPAWDQFVAATFPEDARDVAFELVGWLMVPDTSIQKAVLLTGEGSNGKSTYLSAVIAFLGKANTSNLSLHKLEDDRFSCARLVGKLANICPDLPSAHLAGTSTFKALTGGDSITAERKYVDSFDFTPYARLVFSANHPPRSSDDSWAFFRRWLVIPFVRTFEGNAAIPRAILDARLAQPKELSGVLNRALAGLRRLREKGVFSESASMREAWEELRQTTDPMAVWLERRTLEDPNAIVAKKDLIVAYNGEAERDGRARMTPNLFGRALKRHRPNVTEAQRVMGGNVVWCYVGIGLLTNEPEPPRGRRTSSLDSRHSRDSSNCYFFDGEIKELAEERGAGENQTAEKYRSAKSSESSESGESPRTLAEQILAYGARHGWPKAQIREGSIGPGQDRWELFAKNNAETALAAALKKIQENLGGLEGGEND